MEDAVLRITIVQSNVKWTESNENYVHCELLLKGIDCHQTDLIVFPELFTTGYLMDPSESAEDMSGIACRWMLCLAREKNVAIAGSVIIAEGKKYYNRLLWVTPDGSILTYDKHHLYRYGKENLHYAPGSQRLITLLKGWRICPLICYDLRFPVWSRNRNDYDLLLYVANWPGDRIEIWKTLLKARAIENQCYAVGVNRVGADRHIQYGGNSLIADWNGDCLFNAGNNETVKTIFLFLSELSIGREKMQVYLDADN